jgi:hypothetical protein
MQGADDADGLATARRRMRGGARRPLRERVPTRLLGNERLSNRCSGPSVRAVDCWNCLRVELVGDLLERHPLRKHRVELRPPYVVTLVADPMSEPDVVWGLATSVHLESRIVIGRRHPIGTRRPGVEMAAPPGAVALRHLATHVDELAIPGKSPQDVARPNPQILELLESVVHARAHRTLRLG